MVGVARFELATPGTQNQCSTRLSYTPTNHNGCDHRDAMYTFLWHPASHDSAQNENISFFCQIYEFGVNKFSEKLNKNRRFREFWTPKRLFSIFIVLGLVLAALVSIDASVSRQLMNWPENERRFFEMLARMGESDWMLIPTLAIWLLCSGAQFFPIHYKLSWAIRAIGNMSGFIFVSIAVPGATAALLKVAIGRARPVYIDTLGVFHFTPFAGDWRHAGFPSGHATTAFALAMALWLLFGRRVGVVSFAGALLIGISRIVDGAHYLSDVIVGATLGTVGAWLIFSWFQKNGWIFSKNGSIRNRMLPLVNRYFKRS